jgi:hypothetical protein
MGKDAFKLYDTFIGYGPHLLKRKQRPLGARQIAQLKKEFRLAGRYVCAKLVVILISKSVKSPK